MKLGCIRQTWNYGPMYRPRFIHRYACSHEYILLPFENDLTFYNYGPGSLGARTQWLEEFDLEEFDLATWACNYVGDTVWPTVIGNSPGFKNVTLNLVLCEVPDDMDPYNGYPIPEGTSRREVVTLIHDYDVVQFLKLKAAMEDIV